MRTIDGGSGRRRRRFTAEERRDLVLAWRESGESQNQFAREHGIEASYLSRWKKEFPRISVDSPAHLVPVRVINPRPGRPVPGRGGFELRLRTGVELFVPGDFDRDGLATLLDLLGRVPC